MENEDNVRLVRNNDLFQSESRNRHQHWKRHGRKNFIKTILTIVFAGFLGTVGIIFAVGCFDGDCQTSSGGNSSTNNGDQTRFHTFSNAPHCTSTPTKERMDCWPASTGASQQSCESRGCCWVPASEKQPKGLRNVPWCFYPSNYQGYLIQSVQKSPTGITVQLKLSAPTGWPNDIQNLAVRVTYETETRLNFKIYDPNNQRYEVPLSLNRGGPPTTEFATDYNVDIPSHGPFQITVTRKSTGKVLTQGASPLVFADQFLQIGTQLSSQYLYGLGEHRERFLISTNWTKMGFYSRDEAPTPNANLYGVHPFYLNIEDDHNVHGVFLLNSNAMEIEIQPAPSLTYYTIGGVLDFYVFTGPSSENVVQQYTNFIGRPFMPPYWSLGFHLCRWGYGGTEGMKQVIQRMRDAQMPYDTQWNDIDYMRDHLDWTYDFAGKFPELPAVISDLHQHGQHYIIIVDPGISNTQAPGSYEPYDDGIQRGIFIKTPNGSAPIIGQVWPGTVAFPDFFHPNATDYWTKSAKDFHAKIPFDGLWIDMNEPSSFVTGSKSGCPDNTLENPPFAPPAVLGTTLGDKTLCASAKQYVSTHYNLHSLYGHSEAIATKRALDTIYWNKRSIVISRSTYPGTGAHSGHWLGDNNAHWEDTYWSISGMLNFNLFGIPLVGADICGFNGNSNPELCSRWMQLGAFYPFMRNHNTIGDKDQDPASFDAATQKKMRDALNLRYTLLPYLYTLFYRSHVDGTTVVRPLFFEFPGSDGPYSADTQFMWGHSLLITPVTSAATTTGQGYLPRARWYDWFNRNYVDSSGHYVTFDLPAEHINLQMRGGTIIPTQAPNVTTTLSRKNPFTLMVALASDGAAVGEMYWDDGESMDSISGGKYNLISFSVSQMTLSSNVDMAAYTGEPMTLSGVTIMGVEVAATSITVNGKVYTDHYTYHSNKVLDIYNLSVNLLQPLTISWTV